VQGVGQGCRHCAGCSAQRSSKVRGGGGSGKVQSAGSMCVCVGGVGNAWLRYRAPPSSTVQGGGAVHKSACHISGGDGRGQGEQQAALDLAKGGWLRQEGSYLCEAKGEAVCYRAQRWGARYGGLFAKRAKLTS
jgi:hypothetical protein